MWESSSIINLLNPLMSTLNWWSFPELCSQGFFMFSNSYWKLGVFFARVSWGRVEFSPGLLLCFSRLNSLSQLHGRAFPFIWCVFAVQRTMPRFSAGLQDLVRCCISGYHLINCSTVQRQACMHVFSSRQSKPTAADFDLLCTLFFTWLCPATVNNLSIIWIFD